MHLVRNVTTCSGAADHNNSDWSKMHFLIHISRWPDKHRKLSLLLPQCLQQSLHLPKRLFYITGISVKLKLLLKLFCSFAHCLKYMKTWHRNNTVDYCFIGVITEQGFVLFFFFFCRQQTALNNPISLSFLWREQRHPQKAFSVMIISVY